MEENGGLEKCQENLLTLQDGDPKGEGLPHFLHECANAPLNDHRIDSLPSAANVPTYVSY